MALLEDSRFCFFAIVSRNVQGQIFKEVIIEANFEP